MNLIGYMMVNKWRQFYFKADRERFVLDLVFYLTLVICSLTAIINLFFSASYPHSKEIAFTTRYGVYNTKITFIMYCIQGVAQLGYCMLAIVLGERILKGLKTADRSTIKKKRMIAVFAFTLSFAFICVVAVNIITCIEYYKDGWRLWRSPPCTAFQSMFSPLPDMVLMIIYIFLVSNFICKSSLPARTLVRVSGAKKKIMKKLTSLRSSGDQHLERNTSFDTNGQTANIQMT
uniref:Uncharacterized protein n=1 Tax=Octactis speculum TaxID=3111310 RepID=A0A7S2CQ36_9STRA